jgi:hypothetical protein
MFAVPAAFVETDPLELTVATLGFVLDHAIVRPVSTLPLASRRTAVACVLPPATTLVDPSVTVTDATGGGGGGAIVVTVTLAAPDLLSLVAVIVAEPAATPVTTPNDETVATEGAELDHVTARSVTTAPVESLTRAVACVVVPTWTDEAASETLTEPTGAGLTVIAALAATVSADAVITAAPVFSARTSPESETDATVTSELLQETGIFATTAPLWSCGVAVNRVLVPTAIDARLGVNATVATAPVPVGRVTGPLGV